MLRPIRFVCLKLRRFGKRLAGATRALFPTAWQWKKLAIGLRFAASDRRILRSWWRHLGFECRRFLIRLVLGLSIALILNMIQGWSLVYKVENESMDWMMRMLSNRPPSKETVPAVWLDIDEDTYLAWGEPVYTPRRKLRQLIEYAASGNPRVIIVDVDLSRRMENRDADNELRDFLAGYCIDDQVGPLSDQCPPILFARVFTSTTQNGHRIPRLSFLEDVVNDNRYLFWASPLFSRDHDWVIRHWRLWEPACVGIQPYVIPSFQLLTVAMLQADADLAASYVQDKLNERFLPDCSGGETPAKPAEFFPPFALGSLELALETTDIAQRISYRLAWEPPADKSSGALDADDYVPTIPGQARRRLVLATLPAHQITDSEKPVSTSLLRDRVVAIGGSFRESSDIHLTPLGTMPGALIIINAIQSLAEHGELAPVPLWAVLVIEAVLILIMSVAFTLSPALWGQMFSGLFIFAVLLPISYWLFRYGVWVGFALPLLAVQLHQLWADFEVEYMSSGHGHRKK